MADLLIHHVRALRPGVGEVGDTVWVRDGVIAGLGEQAAAAPPDAERIDGQGRLLTPGLIDLHIHGVGQHLFELSPDDLAAGVAMLPRFGVTCVLPTLYRVMDDASLAKLRQLGDAIAQCRGGARAPGFHLEGPFLALPGAGAETYAGDLKLLDTLLDATQGRITAMSVSPDTPNILPVIEALTKRGIKSLITHTRANVEQTEAAIAAGASHATHFYDVFHLPGRADEGARPVGAVEAILADERVSVDFIADGVHVHPTAIRAALAAKGPRNVLLITDANIGAGMPAGIHESPWGYAIRVKPGDGARMHAPGQPGDGELAGSALTMNEGITNLLRWLNLPEHDVWAMGSRNVAERMGLSNMGDLQPGYAADLVLWDRDDEGAVHAAKTWVAGELVHNATS